VSRYLLAYIGETDCESLGDGLLRQPLNAISSLSYAVVGIIAIASAGGTEGAERTFRRLFGWLMIASGLGSVLYHGPQWPASHFLHDITFTATLWLIASGNGTRALGLPRRTGWAVFAGGVLAMAAVLLAAPEATNYLTVVLVLALIASDVIVQRTVGVIGRWYALALGTAALAVVALVLGRTGSALCEPESMAQGHAVWHLLSAVALLAYVMATAPARSARQQAMA